MQAKRRRALVPPCGLRRFPQSVEADTQSEAGRKAAVVATDERTAFLIDRQIQRK